MEKALEERSLLSLVLLEEVPLLGPRRGNVLHGKRLGLRIEKHEAET